MRKRDKYKPAVTRNVLLFLAGFVWAAVGAMLLFLAYTWLSASQDVFLFTAIGSALALVVHRYGFIKIVNRNLERILRMQDKRCMFSFIPWKSYLIIVFMSIMGSTLRHSSIPKQYLAIMYIGIGLALMLSSTRYFWTLISEVRNSV